MTRQILVVYQSRNGATLQLVESFSSGVKSASELIDIELDIVERSALSATSADVMNADVLVIATPEHFGSMAGATKVFFEEIWDDWEDFIRYADDLDKAARQLAENAGSGKDASEDAFRDVVKACRGCHDEFRED